MKKLLSILAIVLTLTAITACKKPGDMSASHKAEIEAVIKDYIMAHPEVIMQSVQNMQRKGSAGDDRKAEAEIAKRAADIYNNPNSPVLGNPNGKQVVVEFFDYNCPYCKKVLPDLKKLAADNKDVKIIFKELPILGPTSQTTAIAALAVYDNWPQKYMDFYTAMMNNSVHESVDDAGLANAAKTAGVNFDKLKDKMNDKKYQDMLGKNVELAHALSVTGTPTFIINGKIVRGAVGYDQMKQAIAENPAKAK